MSNKKSIAANPKSWRLPALAAAYIVAVYSLDTLALPDNALGVEWTFLRWQWGHQFDGFKFVSWLVLPLACLMLFRGVDWGYFGWKRWKRWDVIILAVLAFATMGAVLLTRVVPSLNEMYPSFAKAAPAHKWDMAINYLAWYASWLFGWEFLHRYVLLRALEKRAIWWSLMGIPLLEALYHVMQKPQAPIEAAGMLFYGAALTWWARSRRNTLLPIVAHLVVELQLLLFRLVV